MARGHRRTGPGRAAPAVLAVLLAAAPGQATGQVAEPSSYRTENYRAAVPATLRGARVVSTEEAEALWRNRGAVFFDVMPRMARPRGLPADTVWREAPRNDIPGSVWLPNVGYGLLTKETAGYFRAGLETHKEGAAGRAILFYCLTDCWMSWNAAKRAIEWGYGPVIWYPAGSDGWAADGLPLAVARPYDAAAAPP